MDHQYEIALWSQKVTNLRSSVGWKDSSGGRVTCRNVPKFSVLHLIQFTRWFFTNHTGRCMQRRTGSYRPDLVDPLGPNCSDAYVIGMHIVLAEFH